MKLKLNKGNLRVLTDTESNAVAGGNTVGTCATCAGACGTNNGCTTPCTSVNCTGGTCTATSNCTAPPYCGGTTIPNWCLGGGTY